MRISEQRALKETGDWRAFIRQCSTAVYDLCGHSYRPRELFTEALIKELANLKLEDIVLARLGSKEVK